MGTVTKSIGSGGGRDYSTIQAWEDALPANLVTDGNAQVGECYNDSEFSFNSAIAFSGETTDATNTITLTAASGQSFQDNANVRTNALRYNQSNGVGLTFTGTGVWHSRAINYLTIKRIQIKTTSAYQGGFLNDSTARTGTAYTDIIYEGPFFISSAIRTAIFTNCVLIQRGGGNGDFITFVLTNDASTMQLLNCTMARSSDNSAGTSKAFGFSYASNESVTVKNCAIFGFGSVGGATQCTGNNNASDQTIGFGSSNQASITYADQFENPSATSGTHDFRTKAAAALINNGATLSHAFDISNTARSGSWDIGAWEVAAAAGVTGPLIRSRLMQSALVHGRLAA